MENYQDVENLIALLDSKMGADGISRINLKVSEDIASGTVRQVSHHGRCDVGSVWATGEVRNETCG